MLKYAFRWFLILIVLISYSIVVNLALVLYSSLMPVIIIVLCLVVLKACVPLFVSITVVVLCGSLFLFCSWLLRLSTL